MSVSQSSVLDRLDKLRDELIATVADAVRIPSVGPTLPGIAHEDFVRAESEVSRLLARVDRACGAEVDRFAASPERENAVGIIEGTGGGRSLILNGHVDGRLAILPGGPTVRRP